MQQLEVELPGDPPFSSFPLKNILRYGIQTEFRIAATKTFLKLYYVSLLLSDPGVPGPIYGSECL